MQTPREQGIEDREQSRVEDQERKQDVLDPFDSGYKSRKLFMTLLALFVIVGMTFAGNWLAGVAAQLGTAVGGILGVLALYLGGNVASKWTYSNIMKVVTPIRKVVPEPPAKIDPKAPGSPVEEPPVESG
jgi:hypothetical protein